MKLKVLFEFVIIVILWFSSLAQAHAESQQFLQYKNDFNNRVYEFANKNRFNIANVNRDKYVNCIMQVGIETTINSDGKVMNAVIKEPSPIPMINKYFVYVINQASPFEPLAKYFGSSKQEISFLERFRLKLNLYENSNVTEPCK